MAEEVERVTDLATPDPVPETTKNKRAKDPKRVAAGCAGAAARKAKMLGALRAAKESPSSSAVPRGRGQYSCRVEGPGTCRQTALFAKQTFRHGIDHHRGFSCGCTPRVETPANNKSRDRSGD